MRVEHTPLLNEFISFWFETHVDGEPRYATFIDFYRCEWHTCNTGEGGAIVLRGELDSSMSEDAMVVDIQPKVEAAIRNGRI